MDFGAKDYLYIGAAFISSVVAIVSDRFINRQNQKDIEHLKDRAVEKEDYNAEVNRIKEVNRLQWEKIDEIKKWELIHEKEAWENRNNLELKIAALHGVNSKLEAMILNMDKKLDDLIKEVRNNVK